MSENKKDNNLSIELDEKSSEGIFSNLALINHSSTEFVLDFVQIMPGLPKGKVKSRIILTPQHAKRLAKALQGNINKFERDFSEILDSENESKSGAIHFGNIQGEA